MLTLDVVKSCHMVAGNRLLSSIFRSMISEGGSLSALIDEIKIIYILMEYEVAVYERGIGKCVSSWE